MSSLEAIGSLAPECAVQRSGEVERVPFSPTDTVRFVADGGPGLPDFYEERAARGDGPPLHSHPWPHWELVIAGRVRFVIADEEHSLDPGDSIYVPPEAPHAYVVDSEAAHIVGMGLSDGRFPALQRKAAELMAGGGEPPMEEVAALAAEHGATLLGPPLSAHEGGSA